MIISSLSGLDIALLTPFLSNLLECFGGKMRRKSKYKLYW
nr:MAG TPA: hypothetical protein [Caudoviricetes sp.]